jgi:putative addiction module component (TIGR02574 family)
MTVQNQAIFDAALALPEADRALLVERLMESLSPEGDELTDAELAADLDRRLAEFQRDPSVGVPWSAAQRRE